MTVTDTAIRVVAAIVVGAALHLPIALAMDGQAADSPTSVREHLTAVVAEEPNLPIAVPTRWRHDWGTFEVGGWGSLDDEVVRASYRIMPAEPSERWAVSFCVAAANADDVIARFENNRDGARAARPCGPSEGVLAERIVDGMRLVISDSGARPAPGDWTTVSFAANWETLDWIDEVHARP